MKFAYLLPLLAFSLIIFSTASSAELSFNAVQDTFTSPTGAFSGEHGSWSSVYITLISPFNPVNAYWMFNNSFYQDNIINSLYFKYYINSTCGGVSCQKALFYITDSSWNETTMNENNSPVVNNFRIGMLPASFAGINTTANMLTSTYGNESTFIRSLYNDPFTSTATELSPLDSGVFSLAGNTTIFSKEHGNPAFLSMNLINFYNILVRSTDVNGTVYFDFEGQRAYTSQPAEWSLSYDTTTGILSPNLASISMSFAGNVLSDSSDMSAVNCPQFAPFSYSTASSIKASFTGSYDIFCFDLSNVHNHKSFYGAIKFINNTNVRGNSSVDVDFYVAMYAPTFTQFGAFSILPNPAQAGRNLTITWSTSRVLSSILRYQIFNPATNTSGAISTIAGNPNLTITHSVTVDRSILFAPSLIISYTGLGTDSNGNTFSSNANTAVIQDYQPTISDITEGATLIITNEYGDPLSAFCTIDGSPPIQTSLSSNFQRICSFFGSLASLGTHTFSITADGFMQRNITLNITSFPFFYTVSMSVGQDCIQITETNAVSGSPACEQAVVNYLPQLTGGLNITSWYCRFDSSGCLTFNSTGTALCGGIAPAGTWKGYACVNGYLPAGVTANTSLPMSSSLGNQTGSTIPALTNPFTSIFGWTAEQGLNFLAMLISMAITLAVAFKTKDVGSTGIIFLGMMGLFTLIGWLPYWFLLLEAIIAILLITRFFRATVSSQ